MRLKLFYFTCCFTSVGALLAKCWGVMDMQTAAAAIMLPAMAALCAGYFVARRTGDDAVREALAIGFAGGIVGTIFYDLARIPFHIYGVRIFAPIAAYGVWLADANQSSRWTDALGWLYHFSNGITFAIMYALFMRGRPWPLAIVWACLLETLALTSPFGRMFALRGNATAIAIAYLGHVAFGVPLGMFVQRWEHTRRQLASLTGLHTGLLLAVCAGLLAAPAFLSHNVERDARSSPGVFRVEGKTLNPDWLRVNLNGTVSVENTGAEAVTIKIPKLEREQALEPGGKLTVVFEKNGIYQVFVVNALRTQSSFVMVEPVERE